MARLPACMILIDKGLRWLEPTACVGKFIAKGWISKASPLRLLELRENEPGPVAGLKFSLSMLQPTPKPSMCVCVCAYVCPRLQLRFTLHSAAAIEQPVADCSRSAALAEPSHAPDHPKWRPPTPGRSPARAGQASPTSPRGTGQTLLAGPSALRSTSPAGLK